MISKRTSTVSAFILKNWNSGMQYVGTKVGFAILLAAASVAVPGDDAKAQQVGTAAAVNPAAQARGSGGSRTIVIGQSIAHRERIQTTSAGSVQLLFLDKTSMTIGPNSDLAIDEYVYDPASNTGKLAATLSKGVMRFVGGQISHAGNAQVTTPNAVVGIRGGVGIFTPRSVFIGYGEGNVRSGSSSVTLGAGEYTSTPGGGTPPTNPGPPPANFLQSVLATLQSQGGQGGGAPRTAGQINQARTAASGSSTGNIATNVQNTANQTVANTQSNAASSLNQSIQTTTNQTRVEITERERLSNASLFGFTGGLVFSRNNHGPFGPVIAALGAMFAEPNGLGQNQPLVGFGIWENGTITPGSNPYNPYSMPEDQFEDGVYLFGPNSATVGASNTDFDDVVVGASILLPSTSPNGSPAARVNGHALNQFNGGVVEIKPGTALAQAASQAVGVQFCQCEYTKWGLWVAETERPGQNPLGGQVKDSAEMFWVAGRLPANATDIPTVGSATYTGHAIAHIQNGNTSYVSAGQFQNIVNYASRTGSVSVSNLDGASYAGQMQYSSGSPVFVGSLTAPNANRSMSLIGSFFQGRTSPVGEMGGSLQINGGPTYGGAGIFAARR
jgi:hypothetical protein